MKVLRLITACAIASAVLASPVLEAPVPQTQAALFSVRKSVAWVWPAQGSITTSFNLRVHDGIDIANLSSLAIRAASAGTVEGVGFLTGYDGYGRIVLLRSPTGLLEIYAHLSVAVVKVGDVLTPGDPIGTAGCTGICYGTHLHFEVRQNGVPVDPTQLLP